MSQQDTKIIDIAFEIAEEASNASKRYPAFNSEHEAYAVLLEEVDELWEEIRKNPKQREPQKIRAEAIQVGAMALRLILDRCTK